MRDGYINELQMSDSSDEVPESIEIMRRMQVDDMEKASHFLLMAREVHPVLNVNRLSLAFIDCHGVAELYQKLSSFEDKREIGISVDKHFFSYSCSRDDLYFN
ncbi:hypothetical protein Tco_0109569 [Tanacetum coccineum]